MKRLSSFFFALTTVLLMDVFNSTAQVVNSESFDGTVFPPTGWTVTGAPQSLWVRRTVGANPTCTTHSGAGMARFTSDMQVQQGAQEVMSTPVVNYIGASGSIPTVSFWIYRDNSSTAGDSVTVFVNTINDITGAARIGAVARSRFFFLPVNETANGWYRYSFNVPVTFNTDTNYIMLRGTARNGGNIFIDDFQWDEYPTACSAPLAGGVVTSTTLICGGSGSTNLSLTGSGLTGGGLSFQWQLSTDSIGPWTDFGTSSSSINSGTLTAPTWFRCYVTCTAGAVTDSSSATLVQVSGNAPPVVTTSVGPNVNICSGVAPTTIAANGAAFYSWSPTLPTNAAGDTAFASPPFTTTYILTGTDSAGCSDTATVIFNVTASPVVTGNANLDTICSGQSVNLNAFVQGSGFGTQFQWAPGPLNGPNQTVSPTITTQYVVAATSQQTGCTGRDTVNIVVNPSPVAGFTTAINNLTYTFTDTTSGNPISWAWSFGDGNTDTVQNPVHTYANNGTYTVTLSVSNGLCTDIFTHVITVVSVREIQLSNGSKVMVFPNPVADITTIRFSYDEPSVQLSLVNSLGQVVVDKTIYSISGSNYESSLDLTTVAKGVYLLQLATQKEKASTVLVKE